MNNTSQPYADLRERLLAAAEKVRAENVLVADQDPFIELWETDGRNLAAACDEAAQAISTLLDRCIALEGALEPFAEAYARAEAACGGPCLSLVETERLLAFPSINDFRRARATLSGTSGVGG